MRRETSSYGRNNSGNLAIFDAFAPGLIARQSLH
jgi:hypothetical protein